MHTAAAIELAAQWRDRRGPWQWGEPFPAHRALPHTPCATLKRTQLMDRTPGSNLRAGRLLRLHELRQLSCAHQVPVDFPGGFAAFVDCAHHE